MGGVVGEGSCGGLAGARKKGGQRHGGKKNLRGRGKEWAKRMNEQEQEPWGWATFPAKGVSEKTE